MKRIYLQQRFSFKTVSYKACLVAVFIPMCAGVFAASNNIAMAAASGDEDNAQTRKEAAEDAKKTGDFAPDFALPTGSGEQVKLSELRKNGLVIIAFYRGGWCPFCNLELHQLQKNLATFESFGAQLIAISPQLPSKSEWTQSKDKLTFKVLSDSGNLVAKNFGLVYRVSAATKVIGKTFGMDLPKFNGDQSNELPVPATYVVNREGLIVYSYVNADYKKRAKVEDIIQALKSQVHK